ncbi:MAG: trimeric intracellular cation channel family protein [Flavobacteriales bacterium]|nr:trimeric intracellular cation channel family protein [Flavobacteriales bacterium]
MNTTFYFDLIGVFFFSLSGTLTARRYKKLDLFGLAFVGLITAIGGGTVRDVIIDAHPIAWVSHSGYFIAIVLGYAAALAFGRVILRFAKPILTLDALAVSFAAIAGLQKSLEYGASELSALVFAVITATVGGVIRDVICNEVPMVLRKEIYASAVMAGGVVYLVVAWMVPYDLQWAQWTGFIAIATIRLLAIRFRWDLDTRAVQRRIRMMRYTWKKLNRGKHV